MRGRDHDPITFGWPPLRTDSICIGTLQLASKMSALKGASMFPGVRCVMWAQLDEIGIQFRGVLLNKPEFKEAKCEFVRWDAVKDEATAVRAITVALEALAAELGQGVCP